MDKAKRIGGCFNEVSIDIDLLERSKGDRNSWFDQIWTAGTPDSSYLFTLLLPNAITPWDLSVCPHYNEHIGHVLLFLSFISTSCIPTFIYPYNHVLIHPDTHMHTQSYVLIHPYIHTVLHTYVFSTFINTHMHKHIHRLICTHKLIDSYIPTLVSLHFYIFTHPYIHTSLHPTLMLFNTNNANA